MIIVRISGGLGNQMFQYALARAIKEQTGHEVTLDSGYFSHMGPQETPRSFELNVFTISLPVAREADTKSIGMADAYSRNIFSLLKRKIRTFIDARKPLHERKLILEPAFTFQELMTKGVHDGSYISGVWQSEKYFINIKDILKKEFQLKDGFSPQADQVLRTIKSHNAVSLHIRRGDYLTNKKTQTLPLDYYYRAMSYIESKVMNPHYFVFSDDIEWVRANLKVKGGVTYVSNPSIKSPEEILLMSACNHNIIANSSFSWWGAWLNSNSEKIVMAPEKWFSTAIDARDLIPRSWVKM